MGLEQVELFSTASPRVGQSRNDLTSRKEGKLTGACRTTPVRGEELKRIF